MAAVQPEQAEAAEAMFARTDIRQRATQRWQYLVLPVMGLLFLLYAVVHSPLRGAIVALFRLHSDACYFACPTTPLSVSHWAGALSAWAFIVAAFAAAGPMADWFGGPPEERVVSYGLCALAAVVIPTAIIAGLGSWLHTGLLRPPAGPLVAATPSAVAVIMAWRRGWRPAPLRRSIGAVSPVVLLLAGLGVVLLSGFLLLAWAHPPTGGDAISYHAPLAVFLWQDGNLTAFLDRAHILWALAHPGTAEIWFGLLGIAGGENLAKLGQLPFALLGVAAIYAFARRLHLSSGPAWLAGLSFLLVPMVAAQMGTQANDVAAAALLAATVTLMSAPISTWTLRRLAILGLGLGLTATTKLVLLPCVVVLGAFVVGAILWHAGRQHPRRALTGLAVVAGACLLVGAPWWIRNLARYGNPFFPAGIPFLGRGIFVSSFGPIDTQFVPGPKAWLLYPLVEPQDDRSGFGALFAVATIPGLVFAALRLRRRLPLFLYGLILAAMIPAWWLLTLHEPRFFLAMAGMSFAFVPWSLLALPRRLRRLGAGLVAAAAIFSALVTIDQVMLPLARQPTNRLEFYDRVWGIDPAVLSLPEREGVIQNTGYATGFGRVVLQEYAAYYPLLGESLSRLVIPVDLEGTTDSIVSEMRVGGVRYAYVAASPDNVAAVVALYDRRLFELVHTSAIARGERVGQRRHAFQSPSGAADQPVIRRYLFRLRDNAGVSAP